MRKTASLSLVAALMAACGGGGGSSGDGGGASGDGGGSSGGPETFTSFSEVPNDGTVRINGVAKTASYTYDFVTTDTVVSSISSDDDAYIDVTYENGEVVRLRIGNTSADLDLDSAQGAVFTDAGIVIIGGSANGEDFLISADTVENGFNYQSFGLWLTGYNTGAGTVGAGSFGAASQAADLPSSGSATFSGGAAGFVTDGTGYAGTISDLALTANFGASFVTVETSNTQLVDIDTLTTIGPAAGLDFDGSGPISGSRFSTSASSFLTSGTLNGQFYGPTAEEVGGTFEASGGGITHVGSFGATR